MLLLLEDCFANNQSNYWKMHGVHVRHNEIDVGVEIKALDTINFHYSPMTYVLGAIIIS